MTPRKTTAFIIIALALVGLLGAMKSCSPATKPMEYQPVKVMTEEYTLEEAARIAVNFLHEEKRRQLAITGGFSGVFPVRFFQAAVDCTRRNAGIALWFCLDPTKNDFFLALEPEVRIYDKDNLPQYPASGVKTLFKSKTQAFYPPTLDAIEGNLMNFLTANHGTPTDVVPIDISEVTKAIDHFQDEWGNECKYSFSFFAENVEEDLSDCLAKAGADGYLRYYIGYEMQDPEEGKAMPNKFRVILVAINANGEAQVAKTRDPGEDGILQSSWPPPPY